MNIKKRCLQIQLLEQFEKGTELQEIIKMIFKRI
jgi:hypothetical protein